VLESAAAADSVLKMEKELSLQFPPIKNMHLKTGTESRFVNTQAPTQKI
jgi:hypothetical protein